jgi:hypothetical protein
MTAPDRILPATPHKLGSGEWGARVAEPGVDAGDLLRVESKRGAAWEAVVVAVIKRDEDGALVRTARLRPSVDGCYLCRRSATRAVRVNGHCDHCGANPHYKR